MTSRRNDTSQKMRNEPSYDSIRSRRRNILGTLSFLPPMMNNNEQSTTKSLPSTGRREQGYQAQRKKDYMQALENEVLRLRDQQSHLNRITDNWKRCALYLMQLGLVNNRHGPPVFSMQLGPRLLMSTIASISSSEAVNRAVIHMPLPLAHPLNSLRERLSEIGIDEMQGLLLFRNFMDEIIPSLTFTQAAREGYINYVLPLAVQSKMASSSIIAASAGHVRLLRKSLPVTHQLKYRSIAMVGLQGAAHVSEMTASVSLVALTTLLGLLIDDIITYDRMLPTLLRLTNYWVGVGERLYHYPQQQTIRQFLLDQVLLMKNMLFPLHHLESLLLPKANEASHQLIPSTKNVYESFAILQNATIQTIQIYKLSQSDTNSTRYEHPNWTDESWDEMDQLLGALQETTYLNGSDWTGLWAMIDLADFEDSIGIMTIKKKYQIYQLQLMRQQEYFQAYLRSGQVENIVARYWQEFWTNANPDIVDELCSEDVVNCYPMHGRLKGKAAIKDMLASFKLAFPNVSFKLFSPYPLIAEHDYVVVRWIGGGKHTGEAFHDLPVGSLPFANSGKEIHFSGTTIFRLKDELIIEEIGEESALTALQQLGIIEGKKNS
ncbi:NTF2 [Fusarium mundagurra]|uniref:NTF2 n=1 Tax=Fusarium mundagurra TaxID=1567541 RepID=A0A8H5Z064_9HYPO|nr:NTF2 [Fusarium mundagurra]